MGDPSRDASGEQHHGREPAGHYTLAAQWLEKAALAHEVIGRSDDWRACLDELIKRHRRKYELRPLLESSRGK